MSNFPCPTALNCPCSPVPWRNFSSEKFDPADFFALAFFAGDPPLNSPDSFWTIPASVAPCESVVSQQDARDCATRTVRSKVWDAWVPDGTRGVPVRQFFNSAQTCQIPCPDGGDPFVYTLPAGTVVALSQAEADELAASICLFRAQQAKVCVPKPKFVTIELLGLDHAADIAVNAKVVAGDLGGQAAYFKNGSAHLVPLLPGTTNGFAFAVDSTGNLFTGDMVIGINDHGFWFKESTAELRDLPTLFGSYSIGEDISDDGFVFTRGNGIYNPGSNSYIATFSVASPRIPFQSSKTMTPTHTFVVADGGGGNHHIYRAVGAVGTDVTPAGTTAGSLNNRPIGINSLGHIASRYETGFGALRTFFNAAGGSGSSVDIGNFGGFVTGFAIAPNADFIVGQADNGGGFYTAFTWNPTNGITLLPSFPLITPGSTAQAEDVNDAGWVVGTMDSKGFVFHDGAIHKLVDLLPVGTSWSSIDDALFINNLKQVVGHGTYLGIAGTMYIMQLV